MQSISKSVLGLSFWDITTQKIHYYALHLNMQKLMMLLFMSCAMIISNMRELSPLGHVISDEITSQLSQVSKLGFLLL